MTSYNLEPYNKQFNVRQKKGSTISLSKTLLISRLIYFTKLSKHSKFSDDEDVLKGYIKQYKDKRIDTANSYISNKLLIINTVLLHAIKRVHESRTFFSLFNPTIISHLCTVKTIADGLLIKRGK